VKILKLDYNECIEKGLLRRTIASEEKAKRSILKSEKLLSDAKKNKDMNVLDGTVILAYMSMFHAVRSVLIRDGFREKSHVCLVRYIEEFYAKENKLDMRVINLLDRFRNIRHDDQYDIDFTPTEKDADEMLAFAEECINIFKKLIKN